MLKSIPNGLIGITKVSLQSLWKERCRSHIPSSILNEFQFWRKGFFTYPEPITENILDGLWQILPRLGHVRPFLNVLLVRLDAVAVVRQIVLRQGALPLQDESVPPPLLRHRLKTIRFPFTTEIRIHLLPAIL